MIFKLEYKYNSNYETIYYGLFNNKYIEGLVIQQRKEKGQRDKHWSM